MNERVKTLSNPAIEKAWADEANRRWKAHLRGEVKTVPAAQVFSRLGRKRNAQRSHLWPPIAVRRCLRYAIVALIAQAKGRRTMRMLRKLLVLALAICAVGAAASTALAETRVALVVGNSAYQSTPVLPNPLNDARDVAAALKSVGFEVVQALDADKAKLDSALRAFADKLGGADVALFFYAGHGLQVGLQNYLLPVDAKLAGERDLEFETVKLDFVLRQMEIDRDGKTTIVILDACRDNPLARNLARSMGTRSASIGRGLAPASTGLGTFIAYSTQPGNVALDGAGRNSPFSAALVKHMGEKGRNLPATMIEVRKDVVAATSGKQVPWDHSALTGDFYFAKAETSVPTGSVAPAPAASSADLAALQERLKKLEEEAKKRESVAAAAPPVSPRPQAGNSELGLADRRQRPHRRPQVQRAARAEPRGLPRCLRLGCPLRRLPARPPLAHDGPVPPLLARRRTPAGPELALRGPRRRRAPAADDVGDRRAEAAAAHQDRRPAQPQGPGLRRLRRPVDHRRPDQDERDQLQRRLPGHLPQHVRAALPRPTTSSSAARTSPACCTARSPR